MYDLKNRFLAVFPLTIKHFCSKIALSGVIAQLIRALPLQGRGPGFESLLLHHILTIGDIAQLVRARH